MYTIEIKVLKYTARENSMSIDNVAAQIIDLKCVTESRSKRDPSVCMYEASSSISIQQTKDSVIVVKVKLYSVKTPKRKQPQTSRSGGDYV